MTGRRALVVGASSEIGRAIAVDLAEQGWATALWGRDRARLEGTAELCAAEGPASQVDVVDVTDRAGLRPALDRVLADGSLDVVVWSAGVFDCATAG